MADEISARLLERASKVIPGGVNSPVRAFKSVGGSPVFIKSAQGCRLTGADGREYIDYVSSWGPMILGHADPDVIAAVQDAATRGASFGAPTEQEIEMAELIAELVPSMPMSRMVSSGTEAVMGAVRAARGFTERDLIVKFEGNYHGGADYLLVKAGSGAATLGSPDSAGVPAAIAGTTLLARYNDADSVEKLFAEYPDKIAAVLVEPVAGNMGCVPPVPGFLQALRSLTEQNDALLIFDEVMTGFRVALGGAQAHFGVEPDLTCLGKIVGGGLPAGVYGGRRDVMERVAPSGPVYQAGTLSGNPLAVAAGLATLRKLRRPGVYETLEAKGRTLEQGFVDVAIEAGKSVVVQRQGSMITPFFTTAPVQDWDGAEKTDRDAFGRWHAAMLAEGIHWPPSQFEAGFLSLAHDEQAIDHTLDAAKKAFSAA